MGSKLKRLEQFLRSYFTLEHEASEAFDVSFCSFIILENSTALTRNTSCHFSNKLIHWNRTWFVWVKAHPHELNLVVRYFWCNILNEGIKLLPIDTWTFVFIEQVEKLSDIQSSFLSHFDNFLNPPRCDVVNRSVVNLKKKVSKLVKRDFSIFWGVSSLEDPFCLISCDLWVYFSEKLEKDLFV